MITATIATGLFIAVVATSLVIARRRLRYEWWYGVHLLAYAAIALSWFHEIPTGNELVLNRLAADYWRGLYLATIAVLVVWRIAVPLARAFRYRLEVAEVTPEGPGVVSLRITGRQLDRMGARAGQFFLWRFLTKHAWGTAHPFSLSAAPEGDSLRITVKGLGDHTARAGQIPVGTRVLAEGPVRCLHGRASSPRQGGSDRRRHRHHAHPRTAGDDAGRPHRPLPRAHGRRRDLSRGARRACNFQRRRPALRDRRSPGRGPRAARSEHLLELVPDIIERDVFLCGPPAMAAFILENVRMARVPRRQIHAERFALI